MQAKNYDEELAEKANELRQRGYTYAEIARELGCSISKAWTLVEDRRRVNSKKTILEEFSKSIEELCRKFAETKRSMEDEVEELKTAIEEARKSVAELESRKSEIDQIIEKMKNTEAFIAKKHIERMSSLRGMLIHMGKKKSEDCVHRNGDVCGKWFWDEVEEYFNLRRDGEKYRLVLNDNNSFAFCGLCPYYQSSTQKTTSIYYRRR